MKNLVITGILSVCIIFTACTQKPENHKKTTWEFDGLKGEVKTLRSKGYTAISDSLGQVRKGEIIAVEWGFNNTFLKYDKKGKWTEYNSFEPDGSIIRKEVQEYDDKRNPTVQYVYNRDTLNHKKIYIKDKDGNTVEIRRLTPSDSLIYKSVFKYDEKRNYGDYIEGYGYASADSLVGKTTRKYDEKGNCIEESNYKAGKYLENKFLYKYDDNSGKRIERSKYDSESKLAEKITYKYNEEGFVTEICIYDSEGKLNKKTASKYKYDMNGNWIEKIDYESDIATKITERQIEYYK